MKRIERIPVERVRAGELVKAPDGGAFYELTRAESIGDGEVVIGTSWGQVTLEAGTLVEVERRIPEAPFEGLWEVERLNKSAGQYFFEKDTLRFFKGRIAYDYDLIFRRFFITTEKDGDNPRRASLRFVEDSASIQTVGEFGQFKSPAAAATALEREIAKGVEVRNDPYPDVTDPQHPGQYNWRCYVGELAIGSRTTKKDAEKIARWLGAPIEGDEDLQPVDTDEDASTDPLDVLRADCGYDPQDFEGRGDALMDYKDALEDRCAELEQAAGKPADADRLLVELGLDPDDTARETVAAWLAPIAGNPAAVSEPVPDDPYQRTAADLLAAIGHVLETLPPAALRCFIGPVARRELRELPSTGEGKAPGDVAGLWLLLDALAQVRNDDEEQS